MVDNDALSQMAHQHHLQLYLGLESPLQVTGWADTMITLNESPPIALIEISTANKDAWSRDFWKLLEPLMAHAGRLQPIRPVLGALADGISRGTIRIEDALGKLASYGVEDGIPNRWLPSDMHAWLQNLHYEAVNIAYVHWEDRAAGVRELAADFVGGLQALAQQGEYSYALRPAVKRAMEARDAELTPAPMQKASPCSAERFPSKRTPRRKLFSRLFGFGKT